MIKISNLSVKIIFIGVVTAIVFFTAALVFCFSPAHIKYIDFFANCGLKSVVLAAVIAFAHETSEMLIKRRRR